MRSLISEFSYGFALTRELVGRLGALRTAPVFPSLIEEGRPGGGYDVHLDAPGVPLFLQFKRSERMLRDTAAEIRAGMPLGTPYYRFQITGQRDSDQHAMLLALDAPPNLVFYAAPMFRHKSEFDDAFRAGLVRQRSFFVSPAVIGGFADDLPHRVSFDGAVSCVLSEPRRIEALGIEELNRLLAARLAEERAPLRETVSAAVEQARKAATQVAERARDEERQRELALRRARDILGGQVLESVTGVTSVERFQQRQEDGVPAAPQQPASDDPAITQLRMLADIGLRDFNAQLYIAQRATDVV